MYSCSYMNEGIPILQEYLTNNIHITDMNGYVLPETYFSYNNNPTNHILILLIHLIIKPLINDNYNTKPIKLRFNL